jgi:hypothetical protein
MAVPLALALDALFLSRVMDTAIVASSENTWQDMVLCGPWGQGRFAVTSLSRAVLQEGLVVGSEGPMVTTSAVAAIAYASMFSGFLAWGAGTFWWSFAVLSLLRALLNRRHRQKLVFGLASWSVMFT